MMKYIVLGSLLALAVSANELKTPCEGRFSYDKVETPGQWTGTLHLKSEFSLHGVWIRVFFDRPVKEILSEDKFLDVHVSDSKTFLLKNKDYVLKKNTPTDVKFTVTYEGEEKPALMGYRLNAREVCPEEK